MKKLQTFDVALDDGRVITLDPNTLKRVTFNRKTLIMTVEHETAIHYQDVSHDDYNRVCRSGDDKGGGFMMPALATALGELIADGAGVVPLTPDMLDMTPEQIDAKVKAFIEEQEEKAKLIEPTEEEAADNLLDQILADRNKGE